MNYEEELTTFAGLPVLESTAEHDPPDPAAVAWRAGVMDYDSDMDELEENLDRIIERAGPGGPVALILGPWAEAEAQHLPHEMLTARAGKLTRLRSLFIGELGVEQCEMSWIQQDRVEPVLAAFPALERLWIRGTNEWTLDAVEHGSLTELVLQSAGLSRSVLGAVLASDLPALTRLDLWLGNDRFGADHTLDDLEPLLSGRLFPALTSLGLLNAQAADDVALAVSRAPVVARLTELDLSLGALTDRGGEALLAGQPLTHLTTLDLNHHYLSAEVAARFTTELPGVRVDVSDRQTETEGRRPTLVFE